MRTFAVLLFVVLAFAGIGFADIQGSALTLRSYPGADGCIGCLFAYIQFQPQDVGHSVTEWGIYAAVTGHNITPLLLQKSSTSDFMIEAIGTTQTPGALGVSWFSFGLVSGSATIGSNYYFGWRDGTVAGPGNAGTISLDLAQPPGPGVEYYTCSPSCAFSSSISVGDQHTFTNATTETRTYSVEAVVPEPAAILLLGVYLAGLAGLGGAFRRRLA